MHKTDDVATRIRDTLVEGVINAEIWLTDQSHPRMLCSIDGKQRSVVRLPLDDQVLDVGIRLTSDARNRITDGRLCIVNGSDDGDLDGFL